MSTAITTARAVTYCGQPHEVAWFGVDTDGEPMVEIRPNGRSTGITQTVPARDVDCAHGYRLSDSCPVCP